MYNGNISETIWKTANDHQKRGYGYQYDALNRITNARSNSGRYDLNNVGYDKMGNIRNLQRTGYLNEGATSFGMMDNLTYSYDAGNKLISVNDAVTQPFGFKKYAHTGNDYEYDVNGNMTRDRNKGITNISYNHLNLPTGVSIANTEHTGNIEYIYDATGVKQKKIATEGSNSTTTEYAGNYIYKNGVLEFFNHAEGYIEPKGDEAFDYIYQYKDHLGNIRVSYQDLDNNGSIDRNTEIKEEKNYYPFGSIQKGYNNLVVGRKHNYGFVGKEDNPELGLDWYDFGARNYDASLGRWMNIDPKADDVMQVDLNPYNFSWNNPVNFNDPDGECPLCLGAVIGFAVEYGTQVATNVVNNGFSSDAFTNVDGGKLLTATVIGAATGGLSSIKVVGGVAKVYKATAVTATAVGGNIVNQQLDGNKTVNAKEVATEIVVGNLPLPKVKAPQVEGVAENVMKTAERELDRAERIASSNSRPSREAALKEAKENVNNLQSQQSNADATNSALQNVPDAVDSVAKEGVKMTYKTVTEDKKVNKH